VVKKKKREQAVEKIKKNNIEIARLETLPGYPQSPSK